MPVVLMECLGNLLVIRGETDKTKPKQQVHNFFLLEPFHTVMIKMGTLFDLFWPEVPHLYHQSWIFAIFGYIVLVVVVVFSSKTSNYY